LHKQHDAVTHFAQTTRCRNTYNKCCGENDTLSSTLWGWCFFETCFKLRV